MNGKNRRRNLLGQVILFAVVFTIGFYYFRSRSKSVLFQIAVATSPVLDSYLIKRQSYYWALAGGASGFLITLAGIAGSWAAGKCINDIGSTQCWAGAAVACVVGASGGIAGVAATGAAAVYSKRLSLSKKLPQRS
ncbi:hypothetical protein HG537_0G05010 [Torulaspora globosa]|uniref:Uncharacterized protein n=1 Tax=Torulaspora globosa TaxID=48254 RepID=A0A7H9I059_9SACH|nr:hypothetical protein HG537_0G05010 [Torulaspora sp. CBS 2947]